MTEPVRIERDGSGFVVEAPAYRLAVPDGSAYGTLTDPAGTAWAELLLDASVHARTGLDETVAREPPSVEANGREWSATFSLRSSLWARKVIRIRGDAESVSVAASVEGDGELADVHLLGAWSSAIPGGVTGFMRSGRRFRTLFTPEPEDPARLVRPASEPATLDVTGGSGPGRLHWFFTPPPYCFAFARSAGPSERDLPDGPWIGVGVSARVPDLNFGAVHYEPAERAFSIRLAYEGQTRVDGRFTTPEIVMLPGQPSPYAAIRAWADRERVRGHAPGVSDAPVPAWWLEPIFCGWGAQSALAGGPLGKVSSFSTQTAYDGFLDALDRHGLHPGTVVIDDRWQASYGTGAPDTSRWPDLRSWIDRRHEQGQRVLLWWKAWDAEDVPAELCVRNSAGVPVAVDPSNPGYELHLRASIRRLLSRDGLDADGLKVDFTARTPSGPGLRRHGRAWGAALLHRLLWIIHDEAHAARPDALIVTHAPHPAFADVSDMLRLNDMLRLSEPDDHASAVEQMEHRARIAAAACPGIPIDTDDWCAPDLAAWRRYLAMKPELGVPALYYTTALDRTGEALEEADYAALRACWAQARAAKASPSRATR